MAGLHFRRFDPDPPGEGPPIVLLHGFASDGRRDWIDTGHAAALTALGRTVIVPDLPAHGDSPAPGTSADAHADRVAAEILAVLDRAGADTFDVAGYSLGSRLAWELPALAGDRVGQVLLGGLAPNEPFAAVDVAQLHRAVTTGEPPGDPFTAMIARFAGTSGLALMVEGLRETPFAPRTWAGTAPPVFVVGEDDVMAVGIERVVEVAEGAELVRVPGGHAEALAGAGMRAALVKFLQR
ncbi:alpha/beta fold hydrolase [Nonomuraea sp. NN258]|uniref:alpha/beta fold hydrolase n=1 Tax=Nonomuraea antri TaxID=2730852 RepID=UPI001568EE0C|nr:alpha/beta fold hydrolase [Nonomuraea antri]NRQ31130.1 alpha/beta fold hydrolase [Nonomuraea antri]